jgi:hypothetical protein
MDRLPELRNVRLWLGGFSLTGVDIASPEQSAPPFGRAYYRELLSRTVGSFGLSLS